jgi:hypothetical protein
MIMKPVAGNTPAILKTSRLIAKSNPGFGIPSNVQNQGRILCPGLSRGTAPAHMAGQKSLSRLS